MSRFYIITAPKSTSIFTENELPKDTAISLEPRLKKIHDSVDFEELRNIIEESVNSYNNSSLAKSSSSSSSSSTFIEQNNELCELIPSSDSTKNLSYSRPNAGRKGFDPVLMFKIFVIQTLFNLSDPEVEKQIKLRADFKAFLNIDLMSIPSHKTIWKYRNIFVNSEAFQKIMDNLLEFVNNLDQVANCDSVLIDSSMTSAPIQRNSREENLIIKEGNGSSLWQDQPAKSRQKDIDARWTKKNDQNYYGYKLHAAVSGDTKLVTAVTTTPANVHDSQVIEPLINSGDKNKNLYADSAYSGQKQIEEIRKLGLNPIVCEKGTRSHPLSDQQKQSNRIKSSTRARVEHVFGEIAHWGADKIRSVGEKRAHCHHLLTIWCYNVLRLAQLNIPINLS